MRFVKMMDVACGSRITTNNPKRAMKLKPPLCVPGYKRIVRCALPLQKILKKGLYFVGEVLDVSGHLGGFNFQWAWASGYAAAQFV